MNDLPIPESMTQLPSSETAVGLPTPKLLAELADSVGTAPIPSPLDPLMEVAGAAGQILPKPQPIEGLMNRA
jgi:hypothetical protein